MDKVLKWIREEKLIGEKDVVLAGVSGGADSVCLLLLLLKLRECVDFSLRVLHVEHGIRGEASREDAAFVEELCRKYQVPCRICPVDVPEYAGEQGLGYEEAARILRYRAFGEEAERLAKGSASLPVKVALAHHANDNAETILFQMIRGSGLNGLGGMRPSREFGEHAVIIRPLLQVSREEIEEYLKQQEQAFRVDATNCDTEYSRNRIRRNVMPELEKINSRATEHMAESGALLCEIADYLKVQVGQVAEEVCRRKGEELWLSEALFEKYPSLLQREVILQELGTAAGSRKDIGAVHVRAVQELAGRQVGRQVHLPYGLTAVRDYGGIRLSRREPPEEKAPGGDEGVFGGKKESSGNYEISLEQLERLLPGETLTISLPEAALELQILDFGGKIPEIHKKKYTKWLNYDKIRNNLQIRKRAPGDYLVLDEMGHKKKLKEYFIEEKIPAALRSETWLLAEGSHICWVIGGRISADCRIEQSTERILKVRFIGGNDYEDQAYQ